MFSKPSESVFIIAGFNSRRGTSQGKKGIVTMLTFEEVKSFKSVIVPSFRYAVTALFYATQNVVSYGHTCRNAYILLSAQKDIRGHVYLYMDAYSFDDFS